MADGETDAPTGSLLLVLPLVIHEQAGRLYIEGQAGNGLTQWLRHFTRMTLGVKLVPGAPPPDSVPIDTLGLNDRLTVWTMPSAWTMLSFLRHYRAMHAELGRLIDAHDYLQFAIGGAWGDWGALGALIAAKRGRKASVWTDRVESEVMRIDARRAGGVRRFKRWVNSRIAWDIEKRVIRRTTLGLFHGKDTFTTYKPLSPNPQLVHDIHLKPADRIPAERLAAKIAQADAGVLDIIYVGRFHPDKGVMDWIETLRLVAETGVPFRARWFGNGPLLEAAQARVDALGLGGQVSFPGLVVDRPALLEQLRAAHIMLFCHLTPESPRCLIEALVSATPIVGYRSAYPEDLISAFGGGICTPMEPSVLAGQVVRLANDRAALAELIAKAAKDGHDMTDEAVFAHRSELMKRYS